MSDEAAEDLVNWMQEADANRAELRELNAERRQEMVHLEARPVQTAFVLAVAASLTVLGNLAAQTPANQDSGWSAAFARLSAGSAIRLHHVDRGRIEGRYRTATLSTLILDIDTSPTELSTAGLDSLWVRGNAARTGALVGAIPGAVAGVTLGVIANNVGCRDDGGDPCPEAAPLLGLAGAAAGALVGALIGSSIPKWHRRIP